MHETPKISNKFRVFHNVENLKSETHADPAGCFCSSKAVLVIFLIENILNRSIDAERHLFFFEPESITRCQVAFAVSLETVNISQESETVRVEDRRKVCARREKIKIDPRTFETLRRDQRELMIGNAKRFSDTCALGLRDSLFAVG